MANATNGGSRPQSIFIFDNMRSRSHLFFRWLSTSPGLAPIYHPFILAMFLGPERFTRFTRNSESRNKENNEALLLIYGDDTHESCSRKLRSDIMKAQQAVSRGSRATFSPGSKSDLTFLGQDTVDERAFYQQSAAGHSPQDDPRRARVARGWSTEPTNLSDEVLDTCTPIMIIRHPAMQVSSVYQSMVALTQCRPGDEDFEIATTLTLSRALYDFLCSWGKTPIIVDAEDMLWRTQDLVTNICNALGIDAKDIQDRWDPVPFEKRPSKSILVAWTEVIWKSSGIERPMTKVSHSSVWISYFR